MSGPPLIVVSGRRRTAAGAHDGPRALDRLEVDVYFTGYADRLAAAGALPLYLPASASPAAAVRRADGLVLTGGSDIDPARYGGDIPEKSWSDPARDAVELALLDAALARELPVLAICRGLQLLNVSMGGTLHAHLDRHPAGGQTAHPVTFTAGSIPARLYGPVAEVNSLHHQGIDVLGAGLAAVGHSPDGVIEAVELPGADLLAVQWHPEQLHGDDPAFAWLVARAAAHTPGQKVEISVD